jgi:hypothetical protein
MVISSGVRVGVGTGSGWQWWAVGALLGPEGSNVFPFDVFFGPILVSNRRRDLCRSGAGRRSELGWVRPYLENCTVDASIFVAKL